MRNNQLDEMKFILENSRLYVFYWLSLSGVKINEAGEIDDKLGRTLQELIDCIWVDYYIQWRDYNDNLVKEFGERITRIHKTEIKAVFKELCCKEKCDNLPHLYEGPAPLTIFLDEHGIVPGSVGLKGTDYFVVDDMFELYNEWADSNDFERKSKKEIGKGLKARGFRKIVKCWWQRDKEARNSWCVEREGFTDKIKLYYRDFYVNHPNHDN